MQNGKIARNERKVMRSITMPMYLEQAALDYIEGKDTYKKGGISQLIAEALKAKLGIE